MVLTTSFCAPMASIVTMHPSRRSISNRLGIAGLSFDFASVFTWPSTHSVFEAQALTL